MKHKIRTITAAACCAVSLLLSPQLLADEHMDDWDDYQHEDDPWESFNRKVFAFNEGLDRWILKPTAEGYVFITPQPVRKSITNVFRNLGEPSNLINNLLQAKFHDAGVDISRFMLNTTFGVLGLFDVATEMGLERSDEDFGQTLGKWGVESGPYVVLPLIGSSSVRDAFAVVPDAYSTVFPYIHDDKLRYGSIALQIVSIRASFLDAEKMVMGDRYTFLRNAYLQSREYRIFDGEVVDDF